MLFTIQLKLAATVAILCLDTQKYATQAKSVFTQVCSCDHVPSTRAAQGKRVEKQELAIMFCEGNFHLNNDPSCKASYLDTSQAVVRFFKK